LGENKKQQRREEGKKKRKFSRVLKKGFEKKKAKSYHRSRRKGCAEKGKGDFAISGERQTKEEKVKNLERRTPHR